LSYDTKYGRDEHFRWMDTLGELCDNRRSRRTSGKHVYVYKTVMSSSERWKDAETCHQPMKSPDGCHVNSFCKTRLWSGRQSCGRLFVAVATYVKLHQSLGKLRCDGRLIGAVSSLRSDLTRSRAAGARWRDVMVPRFDLVCKKSWHVVLRQ